MTNLTVSLPEALTAYIVSQIEESEPCREPAQAFYTAE